MFTAQGLEVNCLGLVEVNLNYASGGPPADSARVSAAPREPRGVLALTVQGPEIMAQGQPKSAASNIYQYIAWV